MQDYKIPRAFPFSNNKTADTIFEKKEKRKMKTGLTEVGMPVNAKNPSSGA